MDADRRAVHESHDIEYSKGWRHEYGTHSGVQVVTGVYNRQLVRMDEKGESDNQCCANTCSRTYGATHRKK